MPLRKRCKKFFKSLLQSRLVLAAISTLIYWYARLVGRTTEWQTQGVDELYRVWEKEGSFIFIGWHGRAMMLPYFWNRSHPLNALVSLHHDGRMIAGLLEKFGMGTIGGSSTENGKNAKNKWRCPKQRHLIKRFYFHSVLAFTRTPSA